VIFINASNARAREHRKGKDAETAIIISFCAETDTDTETSVYLDTHIKVVEL